MRGLTFLALTVSLCSTLSLCKGADASGGGAAQTPATTPVTNPLATDPTDPTVAVLCHIACGDLPCHCHGVAHKEQSLAARLNAIDGLGGLKSPAAIQCLRDLLCELNAQCCKQKEHCGCADFDRTMLALHAIQALGGIGANALSALPEIVNAICISPDLATVIANAQGAIKPAQAASSPAPAATTTPAPTLDQVVQDLGKAHDDLAAVAKSLDPGNPHWHELKAMKDELENMKHELKRLEAACAKLGAGK
jgi:hypothetical protein